MTGIDSVCLVFLVSWWFSIGFGATEAA